MRNKPKKEEENTKKLGKRIRLLRKKQAIVMQTLMYMETIETVLNLAKMKEVLI